MILNIILKSPVALLKYLWSILTFAKRSFLLLPELKRFCFILNMIWYALTLYFAAFYFLRQIQIWFVKPLVWVFHACMYSWIGHFAPFFRTDGIFKNFFLHFYFHVKLTERLFFAMSRLAEKEFLLLSQRGKAFSDYASNIWFSLYKKTYSISYL